MRYSIVTIGLLALLINAGRAPRLETRDYSDLEPVAQTAKRIKWPRRTIEVAFSNSLLSPAQHIKPGSDVVGAAKRALARWSSIANINFTTSWSSEESVSPADGGDGVSLITIAPTLENEEFNADSTTGRTRVFFDPETGAIQEADISINPKPKTAERADIQFSTDGSAGTYDLEATFTHEVGHLLGLDHSNVLASTMQSRQAFNGTYGLPALTERTLSEDDRQRVRSLYGARQRVGRIEGRLFDSNSTTPGPVKGINIWAESVATGRVIASDVTADDGSYSLGDLAPGKYRVIVAGTDIANAQSRFASVEVASQVNVKGEGITTLNQNLLPAQSTAPKLNPRMIGLNGDLSVVALPLEPGKKFKVFLSGEGIDNVPGTSISVNSPYFSVDPASLTREQLFTSVPVISFEVSVAPNAPFGDYTLRLQSNTGELAHVPGAFTIDPGVVSALANPIDDSRFFINQQYKDVTGHEASADALERFGNQLSLCGSRADCIRARKLDISVALLSDDEISSSGLFINTMYQAALGRRPKFSEFQVDRDQINRDPDVEANKLALAIAFVEHPEFERKYGRLEKPDQFIDALISSINQTSGVNLGSEKHSLVPLYDNTSAGRAKILVRLVGQRALTDAQYNQTLVLMHYFAYLRRDPDKSAFDLSLNLLKNKPLRDPAAARSLACSFLNSSEYQSRFAMVATHHASECN